MYDPNELAGIVSAGSHVVVNLRLLDPNWIPSIINSALASGSELTFTGMFGAPAGLIVQMARQGGKNVKFDYTQT